MWTERQTCCKYQCCGNFAKDTSACDLVSSSIICCIEKQRCCKCQCFWALSPRARRLRPRVLFQKRQTSLGKNAVNADVLGRIATLMDVITPPPLSPNAPPPPTPPAETFAVAMERVSTRNPKPQTLNPKPHGKVNEAHPYRRRVRSASPFRPADRREPRKSKAYKLRFAYQGLGFRVQGLGFRV